MRVLTRELLFPWGIWIALALALFSTRGLVHGQPSEPVHLLEAGQLLMLDQIGDFSVLDLTTGEETPFLSLGLEDRQPYSFVLDIDAQSLYVLDGPGCCGAIRLGNGRVIGIDLYTGVMRVIFEDMNLISMRLLPDHSGVMLRRYPPDLERISGTDPTLACLLDIPSDTCQDTLGLSDYDGITWVDESAFVGTNRLGFGSNNEEASYFVDLESQRSVELPILAPYFLPLPDEQRLILAGDGSGAGLFILNLDSLELSRYSFELELDQDKGLYPTSFSPNGEHLLINYNYDYIVVEFETGEVVGNLGNQYLPQWLPDGTGIVSMTFPYTGEPTEIMTYNLTSQTFENIAVIDDAHSFIVIPEIASDE